MPIDTVQCAERTFVLREFLGQNYPRELISYRIDAAFGEVPVSTRATLHDSKEPLAVQLTNIEVWPGTHFVHKAQVIFVTGVPALSQKTFKLRFDEHQAEAKTDLSIAMQGNRVEVSTKAIGVRLPLGQNQTASRAKSSGLRGPILAWRLPNGYWIDASRFYGATKLISWSAEVVDRGPVVFRWVGRWKYANGDALDISVQIAAGDTRALVETSYSGNQTRDGWQFLLDSVPDIHLPVTAEFDNNPWGRHLIQNGKHIFESVNLDLSMQPAGNIVSLVPWADWWDGRTQTSWTFNSPKLGDVLSLQSWEASAWVQPAGEGTIVDWGTQKQRDRWISLLRTPENNLAIQSSNSKGIRQFLLGNGSRGIGREFDRIKNMVLDWPADQRFTHPRLYATLQDLSAYRKAGLFPSSLIVDPTASGWQPSPKDFDNGTRTAMQRDLRAFMAGHQKDAVIRERLVGYVAALSKSAEDGTLDLMRSSADLVNLYDALASEDAIQGLDLRRFRARIAWLGYHLGDPATWSSERGFGAGNLNMHIAFAVNLGLVGAALPDHPMSKQWMAYGLAHIQRWITERAGANGEWAENSHYESVSLSILLPFLLAAHNAGMSDLLFSEKIKKIIINQARQYMPSDRRFSDRRTMVGYGKGTEGERFAISGIYAKAIAKSDPKLASELQWVWLKTGKSLNIANVTVGGYEDLLVDPDLPTHVPEWGSEVNDNFALLSNGLGTSDEHYTFLLTSASGAISAGEAGAVGALFAYGKPVSQAFGNGELDLWTREAPLQSRVLAARDWLARSTVATPGANTLLGDMLDRTATTGTFLPRQDYLRSEMVINGEFSAGYAAATNLPAWPKSAELAAGKIQWTRQLMFVRDDRPEDINYYVFRDSVKGGQPSEWTMWSLSEKLGTAQEAADRSRFLSERPGNKIVATKALPQTDRYTAAGQYGVDLEYYIAQPKASPRYTMRWGFHQAPGFNGVSEGFGEYQDLLHLRLAGDGEYYVLLFPNPQGRPVPSFREMGDGHIIEISGEFGEDWVFANAIQVAARDASVEFEGTAASVQNRRNSLSLNLGAPGKVRFRDLSLAASAAASLRVYPDGRVEINISLNHEDMQIKIDSKYALKPLNPAAGIFIAQNGGEYTLRVPKGVNTVMLIAARNIWSGSPVY